MAFFQMASDTNPLSLSPNFILPENHRPHLSQVKLFNYFLKIQGQEKVNMWSETFSHPWHPTDFLPENPPQYREVFVEYAKEIVLRQTEGVTGLQVIKDSKWVGVDPLPNAFVINLGDQIQVLSNGRYKSVHHRAVTNRIQPRLSIAMFYGPNKDTLIGPIEDLIDEEHPPFYGRYHYAEFLEEFYRQEGTRRLVKEVFELQRN
ncbi:hypothetical protein M0R45_000843 [Rubus argutus]|uniref:Fe2OG dioxygenase domain-containing protein n=1 Tax=Rubus argutus TaxID=59490 RepID=A0AAW1VN57_RUBAR